MTVLAAGAVEGVDGAGVAGAGAAVDAMRENLSGPVSLPITMVAIVPTSPENV